MVYCGKPSRACSQCKEGKVKCDLKDVCRPCVRANLKCSGTRNPNELVFRDESRAVALKAITKRASKAVVQGIAFSIDERARTFFFSHYVLGYTKTFDYIQLFTNEKDQHLCTTIAAVSLAHFSNKSNSAYMTEKARIKYISALRLTNQALQTPELATKDATLLAVLLLDLFEKITKSTPRPIESWTNHVNGALMLVKLRGEHQFNNPIGLRMFLQLSSTILISCVQQNIAPPAEFIEIRNRAIKYINPSDPKNRLTEIIILFVNLRVAMKDHNLPSSDVIIIAQNLDSDFHDVSMNMPPNFQYHTIHARSRLSEVYESFFHVYPCHRVTHIWNLTRIMRILLNEIIVKECLKCFDANSSKQNDMKQIDFSLRTIGVLAAEICASVPQYTMVPSIQESNLQGFRSMDSTPTEPSTFQRKLHTPFQASRCYTLIFPLYVAGQYSACPESMRRWIINRLHSISSDMGIKEAYMVAGFLERQEKINLWSVYTMIESYSFSA